MRSWVLQNTNYLSVARIELRQSLRLQTREAFDFSRGRLHMNDGAACVVKCSQVKEETAFAPHPVTDRGVNSERPGEHKDEHRGKLHAPGKRPRDEGARQNRKRHLENHEKEGRNGTRHRVQAEPLEENVIKTADPGVARGESERVTDDDPQYRQGAADGRGLRQHGQEVLFAAHAAVRVNLVITESP